MFAALNVLDGRVIGRNMQRHRHQELIRFLNAVEREAPKGKAIHAILDNYAVHKHPKVKAWLARHPRWTFHFTPTSASLRGLLAASLSEIGSKASWPLMAERDRGFLRQAEPQKAPARRVSFRGRPADRHQRLRRAAPPEPQAFHLEGGCQGHHRRRQARASNVADYPLAPVRGQGCRCQIDLDVARATSGLLLPSWICTRCTVPSSCSGMRVGLAVSSRPSRMARAMPPQTPFGFSTVMS